MSEVAKFFAESAANIAKQGSDPNARARTLEWINAIAPHKYAYNFTWLGRPVIQFPQDLVAMQELIWRIRPEVVVETGVAHGGSLIFHASMLELLGGDRIVVGVDLEVRPHNRAEIERHPLARRLHLVEGSSIDESVVARVRGLIGPRRPTLVVLDSNHTHDHVLRELELYSPLVAQGSYIVVCDTLIEDMPEGSFPDRPWDRGNNPKTAVRAFLKTNKRFAVDREIENKLLITVAPEGWLKCVED